jgi:hypothetical protein
MAVDPYHLHDHQVEPGRVVSIGHTHPGSRPGHKHMVPFGPAHLEPAGEPAGAPMLDDEELLRVARQAREAIRPDQERCHRCGAAIRPVEGAGEPPRAGEWESGEEPGGPRDCYVSGPHSPGYLPLRRATGLVEQLLFMLLGPS